MPSFALPSGYLVTIDVDGISDVVHDGHHIATYGSRLADPRWYFGKTPPSAALPWATLTEKTVMSSTATGVVIRHRYVGLCDAVVIWSFTLDGEDIQISAAVTNAGTTTWDYLALAGTFFRIDAATVSDAWARTYGLWYGRSQLSVSATTDPGVADGTDYFYPSPLTPAAASYWRSPVAGDGGTFNWACWPVQSPQDGFLTVAQGMFQVGIAPVSLFPRELRPGDTRVVEMVYRFSASADWQQLLSGYKASVRAQAPLQYVPDVRPMGQFTALDASHIRPDNPYGYNDSGTGVCDSWYLCRRFDRPDGASNFGRVLLPSMMATGVYQGILCWQPQGVHPRGVFYRPDFNVFPPETRANLHALADPFTAAGLRFGFQMRPAHTVTSSATWATDRLTRASVHPGGIGDLLTERIDDMLSLGFRGAAYLDSFISVPQDHVILRAMRAHLGPDFQLFTEFTTVASAPYAGGFGTLWYRSESADYGTNGDPVVRWVYDDQPTVWQLYELPPGGYGDVYAYMLSHQMTPLVQDYQVPGHAPMLAPLCAQYIGADHRWKVIV